jgi:DNA sulfur modification protein DndC
LRHKTSSNELNQIISEQELVAIQVIWGRDFITDYTVTEAYNEVYGTRIESLNFLESKNKENEILKSVCVTNPSDADLITNLLNAQKSKILLVNKRGLRKEIEYLIEEHIEPTKSHAYRKDNNK